MNGGRWRDAATGKHRPKGRGRGTEEWEMKVKLLSVDWSHRVHGRGTEARTGVPL